MKRTVFAILPVLVLVGAVAATIIMGALKPRPQESADAIKALPVLTAIAEQQDVTLSVSAQGEVRPRTQINIVPQVGGKLTYMAPAFIEGGSFRQGDLLARVEPAEYRLRVTQARADVAQAQTLIEREQSEAELALGDWEELGRTGQPSALTLREPQLAEARARLEAANARLEEAELNLSRTAIYAPFSGRVTERFVNQGEFVTMGTKLGEVYSTDVMDVRLPLTNGDLARAGLTIGYEAENTEAGVPVTLMANVAGSDARWSGHVVRTDSRFDPETRVLYAYVEVDDPFGAGASDGIPLAPGIYVTAEIQGKTQAGAVVVPRTALRGKDQIYVANDDNTLSIFQTSVVSTDREKAVLSSGIAPGTKVVTSPIRGAAEGMKIEIVERLAAETGAADSVQQN